MHGTLQQITERLAAESDKSHKNCMTAIAQRDELLAALESITQTLKNVCDNAEWVYSDFSEIAKADAAIKKARGY